ncbi:MAG: hypothetical protein ACLFOY_02935 [Desulfatibacillaceae bacterium]
MNYILTETNRIPGADDRWATGASTRLEAAGESLAGFAGQSESDFLNMYDALDDINTRAMELIQRGVNVLEALGGASQKGPLAEIEELALDVVNDLRRFQRTMTDHQDQVDAMSDEIETLGSRGETVERAGKELRMIAMCISLEISRLSVDRNFFNSFVKDIREFADELCRVGRDINRSIAGAVNTQRDAIRELYAGRSDLVRLAERAGPLVNQAVGEVRELMRGVVEAFENTEQHAQTITEQTGRLVMAMQYHDSMSQRLDHVTSALNHLSSQLNGEPESGSETVPGAADVLGLQISQVRRLAEEATEVHGVLDAGFDLIISESDDMLRSLGRLEQQNRVDASGLGTETADPLTRLMEIMGQCHSLLEESASIMERLVDHARGVHGVAAYLENVRRASGRLRILALNANLAATKAGFNGKALLVLATEVNKLSLRSWSFTEEMAQVLAAVERSAEHMRDRTARTFREQGGIEERKARLRRRVEELEGARGMLETYSESAARELAGMRTRVFSMRGGLTFMPRLATGLAGWTRDMDTLLCETLPPEQEPGALDPEVLSFLAERYTVGEEHEVHKEFVSSQGTGPVAEDPPGHEQAREFGGNVEFF